MFLCNMCIPTYNTSKLTRCLKDRAQLAFDNNSEDCHSINNFNMTCEDKIMNMIDRLIHYQDLLDSHNANAPDSDFAINNVSTRVENLGCQDIMDTHTYKVDSRSTCASMKSIEVIDINFRHKSVGYMALDSTAFEFIGPDREIVQLHNLDQYMAAASIIKGTGMPNYRCAHIPITSDLNISTWEYHLRHYTDNKIIQYMKFGFPLGISDPDALNNVNIRNHYSAKAYPMAINKYIQKEMSHRVILGPLTSKHMHNVHCSPMLTRPKSVNKRCVTLDLSFPHDNSVNSQVDSNRFDGDHFSLRFSSIDAIVDAILTMEGRVTLSKIDMARVFHNLHADPADALKVGINWRCASYTDVSVAFSWTHVSAAFQRISDAIVFMVRHLGVKMFAYINDYIIVTPQARAESIFQHICDLFKQLGLSMNLDKFSPPSSALTCLSILFDLNHNTLQIDPDKISEIHAMCRLFYTKRSITRTQFQSLLGKLIYVHNFNSNWTFIVLNLPKRKGTLRRNKTKQSTNLNVQGQKKVQQKSS